MNYAKHKYAVIDIETAPLPDMEIERMMPEPKPWHDSMFDPTEVRTGNLKDPVKINAKIEESLNKAKQDHETRQAEKRAKIKDEAALHPYTGWVFGVGIVLGPSTSQPGSQVYSKLTLEQTDEANILRHIWSVVESTDILINHNLIGFDLPFLIVRSMVNNVTIPFCPANLSPWSGQKLYISGARNPLTIIDTMQDCKSWAQSCKLNWLAHFFGLESKLDLGGKLPWDVAREDLAKAVAYTEQDVILTEKIGQRMQLIPTYTEGRFAK
jgi:hypothetical protein